MAAHRRVAPRLKTSAAGPATSPRACSGATKPGVPTAVPALGEAGGEVAGRGHAEVGEVGAAVLVEEDVRRLDVAVDDTGPVGGGQGAEQVVGHAVDLVGRQRPVPGDPVGEAAALHPRHDEHDVVAVVDDVEQRHDARVVEASEHLGLPADAGPGRGHGFGGSEQGEALEGDPAPVGRDPEVDHAHAAAPEA